MPQMAPINWLFLYCFFMMIFMMFNFLNYYLILYNKKINSYMKKFNIIKMNWKW